MKIAFDFIGLINDDNIITLKNEIMNQHQLITNLRLNISSLGGTIYSGITIYNLLKQMPFPIETHNIGEVSSSAILLYLAGKTRTAEAVSKFLLHPAAIGVNCELPYYKLQELLKSGEADIMNYGKIVNLETNNMNGKYDVEQYLKGNSIALSPQDAYECGIVTRI